MKSILVSIGLVTVMALSVWLAYLAVYHALYWCGLWGAIPVFILVAAIAGGLIWYGGGVLCLLWLAGGCR